MDSLITGMIAGQVVGLLKKNVITIPKVIKNPARLIIKKPVNRLLDSVPFGLRKVDLIVFTIFAILES